MRWAAAKPADGPHGLLAVQRVNPRADEQRHDQTGEQNEQGLAEQALGKKPVHLRLTAGVNM